MEPHADTDPNNTVTMERGAKVFASVPQRRERPREATREFLFAFNAIACRPLPSGDKGVP
jgi:hypothetical protein